MNKFILVALLALVACNSFTEFQKFIKKYNKKYTSIEEFMARYVIFKKNYEKYALTLGLSRNSWKRGITKFSDMTIQEFRKTYLTLDFTALAKISYKEVTVTPSNDLPETFNWKDKGAVSSVKNQGSCGSCWAFATVANLEGLYYLNKNEMIDMSPQLLVDCDTLDSACQGGLMEYSFTWLQSNCMESEKDYPYKGYKTACKLDKEKCLDFKVTGYKKLGSSTETWSPVDEKEIKEFLVQTGPLAIAVNADLLQYYSEGIIDADKTECDPEGLNHAVTIVGYGKENDTEYWIVKNSWGEDWGEEGYFRMKYGDCVCGICEYITSALVEF